VAVSATRASGYGALLLWAVALFALDGCGRRAPTTTPDGVVRELVERLQRVHGDPRDAHRAFELLSKRAQQNLGARAQRYSAASGKAIAPEAMLVPSRLLLRFEPQSYAAQVSGSHARVEVLGFSAADHAEIPCVFEDNGWRVDLALPPLPAVEMRPSSGQP
jgi:hypothetical protein